MNMNGGFCAIVMFAVILEFFVILVDEFALMLYNEVKK